jgi:hypothetical protein
VKKKKKRKAEKKNGFQRGERTPHAPERRASLSAAHGSSHALSRSTTGANLNVVGVLRRVVIFRGEREAAAHHSSCDHHLFGIRLDNE